MTWTCLLCQRENQPEEEACVECGVPRVLEAPGRRQRPRACVNVSPVELPGGFTLERPYYYVLCGLGLALLMHLLMCGVFDFGVQVFFHELGHAIVAWAFGMPSVPLPMFGFAISMPQFTLLALAIWGGLGYQAWQLRERSRRSAIALGVAAGVYPLLAFSGAAQALVSAGGHGGEVVFASLFLWRALEPRENRFREIDRALYSMMAWLLIMGNLSTFYRLATSRAEQHRYATQSVLGVGNDFMHISDYLGLRLGTVSFLFLVFIVSAVAATGCAWWWLRWRARERAPG